MEFRQADLHSTDTHEDALFALVDGNTRLFDHQLHTICLGAAYVWTWKELANSASGAASCFAWMQSKAWGAVQFDVQVYQADFVMAGGHKWMFGPEGLGVFYNTSEAKDKLKLTQYGCHMMKDTHN